MHLTRKTNSFVIIEYKNTTDDNVLNQGQSYYELLRDETEKFIERLDEKDIKYNTPIHFSKTKVMIISPEFSDNQLKELSDNFELWKVSLYDDGEVTYQNLKTNDTETLNIDLNILKLNYENLFEDKTSDIRELYESLEDCLTSSFDDLKLRILVDAVSFRVNNKLICLVNLKSSIKIHFFTDALDDSQNKTRDISDITTGGLANYEFELTSKNEIDYAKKLFKQVYDEKLLL